VKFSQSLTTGTIGFEGYLAFDEPNQFDKTMLATLLENVEAEFSKRGYKIASLSPTNSEKVKKIA
jgi:hypothetical protein